MPFLRLRNVRGKAHVGSCPVRELSLELERGERLALLGPARSGKSSALALLAGFAKLEAGEIALDGRNLAGTPAHRRGIAIVQAEPDLLPDLSVSGNLDFVASLHGTERAGRRERVQRALVAVERPHLGDRSARLLAPAERQRVALARALIGEPRLVLLDEPFSFLDPDERRELRQLLRQLQLSRGLTSIVATRDPADAFALADRIGVLREGTVAQLGTPRAAYEAPASAYVARVTGEANCLPCVLDTIDDDIASVRLDAGPTVLAVAADAAMPGARCLVVIRPERVAVAAVAAEEMGADAVPAIVREIIFRGDHFRILARIGATADVVITRPAAAGMGGLEAGEPAAIAWQPAHALAFPLEPSG